MLQHLPVYISDVMRLNLIWRINELLELLINVEENWVAGD